jgi:tRNA nucleotidyltransferase (CCA-adding enzyme)
VIGEVPPTMDFYLVGGAVRDELLGIPVVDRDWVIVGAHPDDVLAAGFRRVDADFPVFVHPETGEEYALARRETKTGPGYKGFTVDAGPHVSLEEDLARRDLTINAMAKAADGAIVDPFGGRSDLDAGLLRHVTPAFREDPVRILRIARFAAKLGRWGFTVADTTRALLKVMAAGADLKHLRPERVWREMRKALGESHPWRFFEVLHGCGALQRLLPELAVLVETQEAQTKTRAGRLIDLLRAVIGLGGGDRACFAAFMFELAQQQDLDGWRRRIPAERDFYDLAEQVVAACPNLSALAAGDARAWLDFFNRHRGFTQPQRLAKTLLVCRALAGQAYPEELNGRCKLALEAAAAVDAKRVMDAGYRGSDIGRELERRRVAAIARVLQSDPG